jgi:hypothetical protein
LPAAGDEEKLRKLVALALGSNQVEEARTAALLALKFAAKVGLAIEPPIFPEEEKSRARKRTATGPKKSSHSNGSRERHDREREEDVFWRNPGGAFVTVQATRPGTCKKCGRMWLAGEVISSRDERTYHAGCAASIR